MPANGRNIDELAEALFFHNRQPCRNAVQHATDVDINHLIPFIDFQRFQCRKRHHTGIVDDDIHLAEFVVREIDESGDIFLTCDIQRPEFSRTASATNIGDQFFQPVGAPRADHDMRAFLPQQPCRCFPDTAACSRDCNDFSVDS